MNLGAENNRFDTIYCNTLDVSNGIFGGGGVKQLELYSGTDAISAITGYTNYNLSDSVTNYDYLVIKIIANEIDTQTEKLLLVDASSTKIYEYSGNAQAQENSRFNGWLQITNSTTLAVALRYRGTNVNSVCLASVTGIKCIDTDIKNVTSLDETLLYSGNDTVTATSGSTGYTLNDDITNFDYIIIEVEGNQPTSTNPSITKMCSSQQLESNIVNYSYSIGEHRGGNYTAYFDGWVTCATSEGASTTTIRFALRDKTSNINSVVLKSVIGIKINTLTTADIAEMAMPSEVNITISDIIDDSTYTATANGLVLVQAIPSSTSLASVYIRTLDGSSNIIRTSRNINYGSIGSIFCSHMVAKGDTIGFSLVGCTASSVKFFYSVGDAKALGLI